MAVVFCQVLGWALVLMALVFLIERFGPAERYSPGDEINSGFHVVVEVSGAQNAIPWDRYTEGLAKPHIRVVSPAELRNKAGIDDDNITIDSRSTVSLDGDTIVVSTGEGNFLRKSTYRVTGDAVVPLSFRDPKEHLAFIFLISFLVFALIQYSVKRVWGKRRRD